MNTHMEDYGYTPVEEFRGFKAGVRVRSVGQKYIEAVLHGTGVVEKVYVKGESSWTHKYHAPDVEIIVRWDDESRGLSALAHYSTALAVEPDGV